MGNPVTTTLPPSLDSFLQDIAQIHGVIDYEDISDFNATPEALKKLRALRREYTDIAEDCTDCNDPELAQIADKIAVLILENT